MAQENDRSWHGTTILSVRKDKQVVIAGDGQVTLGDTVIKANALKVRRLGDGDVIGGFAGLTMLTKNSFLEEINKIPAN